MAGVLVLAGCGVPPSGVVDGGQAPTGIASHTTLYFLDADGDLVAQRRETGRLGTIADALALLRTGPGRDSALRSEIPPSGAPRTAVTVDGDTIELRLPYAGYEMTPRALDQMTCTALASHIRSGGSRDARVRLSLTITAPDSRAESPRRCPVLG